MKSYIIIFLCLILIQTGCSKKKVVQKSTANEDKTAFKKYGEDTIDQLYKADIEYKWLIGRAKVSIQSQNGNFNVSSSIKIRKDSLLFSNAILLIEAGRLFINQDSAVLVNNMQKEVSIAKKEDFKKLLPIDGISISTIQRLMLGLTPFKINKKEYSITNNGSDLILRKQTPTYLEEMSSSSTLLRLNRYFFKKNQSESVDIEYSNYQLFGNNTYLPTIINITTISPEKTIINMEISSWDFQDTYEFNFKVPSSYQRNRL